MLRYYLFFRFAILLSILFVSFVNAIVVLFVANEKEGNVIFAMNFIHSLANLPFSSIRQNEKNTKYRNSNSIYLSID